MLRRNFLKLVGTASAAVLARNRPLFAAAADGADSDFFIFVHASGGWDVTLWSDPRNERKGLVEPASTANTDIAGLKHWKDAPLDGDARTFEILRTPSRNFAFGPAIGALFDHSDRLTIVNGLEMNTVSHPDGVAYCATGRHLQGGHSSQASIDVAVANERGRTQLVPAVSVEFPSTFAGDELDRRVVPLRITNAASFAKALERSDAYLTSEDRHAITALLTAEANDLAARSSFPETYTQFAHQYEAQSSLVDTGAKAFEANALRASYPMFDYRSTLHGRGNLAAAFALEAMKRNLVRCVAFSLGGLDTHNENYKQHAKTLQDLFGTVATLLDQLDRTPHPTKTGAKLADHTHILVFSDFCRTPQLTLTGGRDHYPNNSAMIISPKFKNGVFGATDFEQLLPATVGKRPALSPPDVLATFLRAFGASPARYLRDGTVQQDMLV
jgi:uncharacterized protein (DUF1501 family)